jgi:hypothetical protein
LLGSSVLVAAAFISLAKRRIAARVALAGVLAIWSFYFPVIAGAVRAKLTDQRLTLRVVKWVPFRGPLISSDTAGESLPEPGLSETELDFPKKLA